MKLMRVGSVGSERPVVLDDDARPWDASDVCRDFTPGFLADDGLGRLRAALHGGELPPVDVGGERIGTPITRPGKIVCVGLNYTDHAAETGMALPEEPVLFSKASNTATGPGDALVIPPGSQTTDWEVELGIVVGTTARYLTDVAAARAAIAGFVVSNDISERTYQLERGGQWLKGKSCESFNPFGPTLTTADAVDPSDLRLRLWVNGELMQDGSTATMVRDVDYIVWYVSQFMVLEPGDLINTGTPPGVGMGMQPPRYLRVGDIVEAEIEGLGRHRQVCVDARTHDRTATDLPARLPA